MANRIYHCVLLDDELLALSYMRTLCERIPQIQVIRAFDNPESFLEAIPALPFDFLISDIVMPGQTGLEVAEKLNGIPVIFTTAHNEYAVEAFEVDAVDYLKKPVQLERLEKALRKALDIIEANASEIKWNVATAKGRMTFLTRDIVSLSAGTIDSRDKQILLSDGSTETIKNKSFQQLSEELHSEKLIRISKSELFNTRYFQGYNGDLLLSTLKNDQGRTRTFVISENYKKDVASLYEK